MRAVTRMGYDQITLIFFGSGHGFGLMGLGMFRRPVSDIVPLTGRSLNRSLVYIRPTWARL